MNIKKIRNCEICIILTKIDKLKTKERKEKMNLEKFLEKNQLNKNLFKTSIKESNGIVLLKKFLLKSNET